MNTNNGSPEPHLEIPLVALEILTDAFAQGLWEDFCRLLTNKLPQDYDELLAHAEKYINIKEAQKTQQEQSNPS